MQVGHDLHHLQNLLINGLVGLLFQSSSSTTALRLQHRAAQVLYLGESRLGIYIILTINYYDKESQYTYLLSKYICTIILRQIAYASDG